MDNALVESSFAALKVELVARRRLATAAEARREIFDFIERFSNTRGLHTAHGYMSPTDFERLRYAA